MNWVGGSRARIQKNNTGFVPTNQNRRGASQSNRGRGFNNGISSDNDGPNGQQNRRLPYSNYDVSCDPRYELVSKKSDAARYRSVPLLEQVKSVFPNGELLSLQLSHQMEIHKVRGGSRPMTYQSISGSEYRQEHRRQWSTTDQRESRQSQEEDDDEDDDASSIVSDVSKISGATTFPRKRTNISEPPPTRNETNESQKSDNNEILSLFSVLSQSSGKSVFPFNHQGQKENTAESGDVRSLFENKNDSMEIVSQSSEVSSTSRSLLSGKTSIFRFNHSRTNEDDHTSEHSSQTKSSQIQLREKPSSSNTSELPSRPTTESREDDTNSRTSSNSALSLLNFNRIESRVVSRGEDHIVGRSSESNLNLLRIFENRGRCGSSTPEQYSGTTLFYDSQESLGSNQGETSIYFGDDSNTAQVSSSDTKENEIVSSEAQQHSENHIKGTEDGELDEEESSYFERAVSSIGIKSEEDLEGEVISKI